ncbi:MAG: PstS family phosphate ABC transporter substrate-binding protein [Halobacteriales archaeon]|nr:PstS family phosphate ABC transporter substrate-binding protein [Halobacteriales archaeon]
MASTPSDEPSRRTFLTGAGAAGLAALAGCATQSGGDGSDGGTADSLSGSIAIAGSSTVFPLATQMKQAFQEEHPEVTISIQSTGSGGGFQNHFCPGDTDFNNSSRPIKDAEKELCSDNGVEWVELQVATDALTVVVNNDNDWVDCLTVDELKRLWVADGATKWSDVNAEWPDEEINRFGPTEASGTFDYFKEEIIGEDDEHTSDLQATEQDRTIIQGVQNDQYALGYFGFAFFVNNKDAVKALSIDDGDGCVPPTLENAKSGTYAPLSRPLFTYPAVSSLENKPQVRSFAEFFVRHTTDQEIVADKVGYVPNTESEMQDQLAKLEPYLG